MADVNKSRTWLSIGSFNGALAVAFGAVGAHALDATASAERVDWLSTGARYHMVHALVARSQRLSTKRCVNRPTISISWWCGFTDGWGPSVRSAPIALLAIGWVARYWTGAAVRVAGILFVVGMILFSCALYAAGVTGSTAVMPVVPVGGMSYIPGWLALFAGVVRGPPDS